MPFYIVYKANSIRHHGARRTTTMDASGGRASHGISPATDGAAIALRALQRAPPPAGEDETAAGAASGFVSPGISRELNFSSPPAPAGETQAHHGFGGSPRAAPAPAAPHAAGAPPPATPQRHRPPPSEQVRRSPRHHPAPAAAPTGVAVPYARPELMLAPSQASRITIPPRGGESQSPRRDPLVLWAADGK